MNEAAFTRRQIIKALAALGLGGAFVGYWKFSGGENDQLLTSIMDVPNPDKASPEMFAVLSSLITLRQHLDPAITSKLYTIFMDEPWGAEHIVRLFDKIKTALQYGAVHNPLPAMQDTAWQLDDGEKWFASHLLTTWYLGIYYHEKRPTQRVAYEKALMFEPTKNLAPIPYAEAVGFGTWANPPDESKQ